MNTKTREKIDSILENFQPDGILWFSLLGSQIDQEFRGFHTDEEDQEFRGFHTDEEDQEFRGFHTDEKGLGGWGVTGRTLEKTEEELPGVSEILYGETGKVIFLGNGFSPIPIVVSERYLKGLVSDPPIVVDVLDYRVTLSDMIRIRRCFEEENIRIPGLESHIRNVSAILDHSTRGNLCVEKYFVGSGNPPATLRDASLVFNYNGPDADTSLGEQLRMLAPGGRLIGLAKGMPVKNGGDFSVKYFPQPHGKGLLITRLR